MIEARNSTRTRQVMGSAVQDLAARRLGRALIPLAAFVFVGSVDVARTGGSSVSAWVVVAGALASAGALLVWTLAMVKQAFGVGLPSWIRVIRPTAFLAWIYGLWLVLPRGLVPLVENAESLSPWALVEGLVFVLLGARFLALVWRISEIGGLATVMALPVRNERGERSEP